MKYKSAACLAAMMFVGMTAYADNVENGSAFGDPYGNTQYEIVTKTPECGFTGVGSGEFVRVLASAEYFNLNFPSQPGGYMSYLYFSVQSRGEVSPTTEGVFHGYVSATEFQARESLRPPYSPDGPITLTEHVFALVGYGQMNYSKKINGVEALNCTYRRI